ncbi:signal recognition particle protein [Diaporthe helianthi]|uniref:Signal recognition particle subunit SRP68 n=1 Tax=Diaporthe helianthi TaxID=158607 RepID=A0A2P5I0W8_DIAHE|nr:signal recognition particle protein [Diaporthe helianthi]
MDTTKIILNTRLELLSAKDYANYASKLSTRLRSTRKRLGITGKSHGKPSNVDITPAQLAQNHEFIHVPLLKAERCWAKSMAWHSRDTTTKATRTNIISKLVKAVKIVQNLVATLSDSASGATASDVLSARAYAALLKGDCSSRARKWEDCLISYSIAKIIYSALPPPDVVGNTFRDHVSDRVDIPLRLAQRQQNIPTSISLLSLAKQHLPRSEKDLVSGLEEVKPGFLEQDEDADMPNGGPLKTVKWRTRQVPVEDAEVVLKLAAMEKAASEVSQKLGSSSVVRSKLKVDVYDDILATSNYAIDATVQVTEELKEQGVPQGDPRMQNLAVLRTKLKYDLLSWQIGRNRVLLGQHDGALLDDGPGFKKSKSAGDAAPGIKDSRLVKQLGKKTSVYTKTIQILEEAKELPGVSADEDLVAEIDAVAKYFTALKSLAIARAHTLVGKPANALALIQHAHDQNEAALPVLSEHSESEDIGLKTIDVIVSDAEFLQNLLKGELQRCRAVVQIANLRKEADKGDAKAAKAAQPPLIDRLGQYPSKGVDPENIVPYPPKMEPIPIKPLFLDVAYNHVQYPKEKSAKAGSVESKTNAKSGEPEKQPAKKGWFGFGRG